MLDVIYDYDKIFIECNPFSRGYYLVEIVVGICTIDLDNEEGKLHPPLLATTS